MMNKNNNFFEAITHSIDLNNGSISFQGQYAVETKDLSVSSLIPYIARDIFLAQKDEALLRDSIEIKVLRKQFPHLEIIFSEGVTGENFKKIETTLIKILWHYNSISYDAKKDKCVQRFSYSFHPKQDASPIKAVA